MLEKLVEKWQGWKTGRIERKRAEALAQEKAFARQRQTANEFLEQLMSYVNAGDVNNTKLGVENYYNVAYMLPDFDDKVIPGYICQAIVNNGLNSAKCLELEFSDNGLDEIIKSVERQTKEFASRIKENFNPESFKQIAYNARELVLKETVETFIQLGNTDQKQWDDLKERIRLISVKRAYSAHKIQEIQEFVERKFKGSVLEDIAKYVQDMHLGLTRKPIDHIPRIERLVELYNQRFCNYTISSAVYELAARNIAREIRYNIHGLKNAHKAKRVIISHDLLKEIVEYFYKRINDYSERTKHARDQSMLNRDENQLYVELRDVLNQVIISSNGDLQGSEKSKSKRLLGRFEEDHSRKIMYGRKAILAEKMKYGIGN